MRVRLNSNPNQLIADGPTINVVLGIDGKNIPELPDDMEQITLPALIDTGATGNSIDEQMAESLRLPLVDTALVAGIRGRHEHGVYVARVYVPSLAHPIYDNFTAVDLVKGGQPHAILLGRTFLANFSMVCVGQTGEVVLDDGILSL